MSTLTVCDRCKKEIPYNPFASSQVTIPASASWFGDLKADLCPTCVEELNEWMVKDDLS